MDGISESYPLQKLPFPIQYLRPKLFLSGLRSHETDDEPLVNWWVHQTTPLRQILSIDRSLTGLANFQLLISGTDILALTRFTLFVPISPKVYRFPVDERFVSGQPLPRLKWVGVDHGSAVF